MVFKRGSDGAMETSSSGSLEEGLAFCVVHDCVFQGEISRDRERRLLIFRFNKGYFCDCIQRGRNDLETPSAREHMSGSKGY